MNYYAPRPTFLDAVKHRLSAITLRSILGMLAGMLFSFIISWLLALLYKTALTPILEDAAAVNFLVPVLTFRGSLLLGFVMSFLGPRLFPFLKGKSALRMLILIPAIAALFWMISSASPAQAQPIISAASQNIDPQTCRAILTRAAQKLGLEDFGFITDCRMWYTLEVDGNPAEIELLILYGGGCEEPCVGDNPCELGDINGAPYRLNVNSSNWSNLDICDTTELIKFRVQTPQTSKGNRIDPFPMGQEFYAAAFELGYFQGGGQVPIQETPIDTVQPNPVEPVMPDPVEPVQPNPVQPVNPPSGYDPVTPTWPTDATPLDDTPIIPLGGAFLGTIAGWLVSAGFSAAGTPRAYMPPAPPQYYPPQPPAPPYVPPAYVPPAPPAAQPQAAPIKAAPPPMIEQPPAPIPAAEPPQPPPAEVPAEPPPSAGSLIFDLVNNLEGASATVSGLMSDFMDFADSPETIKNLRKAMETWKLNPGKATGQAYLDAVGKTANASVKRYADALGNVANVMDALDGVKKGLDKANELGYQGSDRVMAVSAEVYKKTLNFYLNKIPYVAMTNLVVGTGSEVFFGTRVDISKAIDLGADSWDKTTQEYLGYTDGALVPDTYENMLAKDPVIQQKDDLLDKIRRVKTQVDQGKISRQTGAERIRKLRSLGGE